MPLNQTDFDNIAAAVKKPVVATSWKQTLTFCATITVFSIGCMAWWTPRLDGVDDKLDAHITTLDQKLDAHLGNIEQALGKQGEVLARLDERTQVLTSSGNGSSKRPSTKGGSPNP